VRDREAEVLEVDVDHGRVLVDIEINDDPGASLFIGELSSIPKLAEGDPCRHG
jgi:hypothetical protein